MTSGPTDPIGWSRSPLPPGGRPGEHQIAVVGAPAADRAPAEDVRAAAQDGRTRQESLLLMVPIRPAELPRLERLLAEIADPPGGEDLEVNPVIPFRRITSIHFARIL